MGEERNKEDKGQSLPLTTDEVTNRWGITDEKLKLLVRQQGLSAYFKMTDEKVDPSNRLSAGPFRLPYVYFKLTDIEKFEANHPELIKKADEEPMSPKSSGEQKESKPRKSQRHKERCRALAEYKWKKFPDTNIAEMMDDGDILEIGCERKVYKPETIREWIRDLCPNPKPGRPKKD